MKEADGAIRSQTTADVMSAGDGGALSPAAAGTSPLTWGSREEAQAKVATAGTVGAATLPPACRYLPLRRVAGFADG